MGDETRDDNENLTRGDKEWWWENKVRQDKAKEQNTTMEEHAARQDMRLRQQNATMKEYADKIESRTESPISVICFFSWSEYFSTLGLVYFHNSPYHLYPPP